ncbi:hypothetical protein L195_g034193, partial [Trifolium pratense]
DKSTVGEPIKTFAPSKMAMAIPRAVRTGYPARLGPALTGDASLNRIVNTSTNCDRSHRTEDLEELHIEMRNNDDNAQCFNFEEWGNNMEPATGVELGTTHTCVVEWHEEKNKAHTIIKKIDSDDPFLFVRKCMLLLH